MLFGTETAEKGGVSADASKLKNLGALRGGRGRGSRVISELRKKGEKRRNRS